MKRIIVLILLLSFPVLVSAQTYYVDASSGSDAWTGTLPDPQGSDDGPWRTIGWVNAATFLQPGDSVLFKRGETWRETLIVRSSGTDNAPITFGAYGIGDKPLLDGLTNASALPYSWALANSLSDGAKKVWYLTNGASSFLWYFAAIEESGVAQRMRYKGGDLAAGQSLLDHEYARINTTQDYGQWTFYVRSDAGAPGSDGRKVYLAKDFSTMINTNGQNFIVIENLAVRGGLAANGTSAVLINNSADVKVRNSEIYFSKIAIGTLAGTQRSANSCWVTDNEVHDNLEGGIYIAGDSSNNTISRNHVHHNFNLGEKTGDLVSIGITGSNDAANRSNNVIEYNNVHDDGTYGIGTDPVIPIYQATNTAVRYNDIHDNQKGAFYFAFNSRDSKFYYNRIYRNRVKNGFILMLQGTDNLAIYNNTVYDNHVEANCEAGDDADCDDMYCAATRTAYSDHASCEAALPSCVGKCVPYGIAPYGYGSYRLSQIEGPATNARVENNIIAHNTMVSNTPHPAYLAWVLNDTARMDHNLYFDNASTDRQDVQAPLWRFKTNNARATLGEWQADGQDSNSMEGDPYFADPTNDDFHLLLGSPAVDRGNDVGLTQDIDGVLLASQPDIGAHELPQANLSITLTDSPDPMLHGGTVTYTSAVTNNGPSPATNVIATGTLPTCNLGTLASGTSGSCTATVTTSSVGTLTQTMTVSATEYDPNSGNNSATASTTVNAAPDLITTQVSFNDNSVRRGNKLSVTHVVKNQGSATAGPSTIGFRLSTDSVYGNADDIVILPTRSISTLATGATSPDTTTKLTVPSTTPGGSYYVCGMADSQNTVTEGNENNNHLCSGNRVNVTS